MSDYSCYVAIDASQCASSLNLQSSALNYGSWAAGPVSSIAANTTIVPAVANLPSNVKTTSNPDWPIVCQAATGTWTGSDASMVYTTEDGVSITFSFCCSWSDNNNSGGWFLSSNPGNRYQIVGYYASNPGGAYLTNTVPDSGSPSYFVFVISTTD